MRSLKHQVAPPFEGTVRRQSSIVTLNRERYVSRLDPATGVEISGVELASGGFYSKASNLRKTLLKESLPVGDGKCEHSCVDEIELARVCPRLL